MLKAEIVTDVFDYEVDIPEEYQNTLDAWKFIKDTVKSGMPLEGKVLDQRCAFSIEPGSSIKHIRIYDDAINDKVAAPDPTALEKPVLPKSGAWLEEFDTEFSGQAVKIQVMCYAQNGHLYLMPVLVNGTAACDMIGKDNLRILTKLWAEEFNDGQPYNIIMLEQPITDYEETKAYILDYAAWAEFNEKDPAIGNKGDAKAWQGWREQN